ncbi:hypothetical protein DL764_000340 [Monosporascus ibericus]|uniref:Uncharacterized protein n=1 Tax=Monosporascus ibericus TaxID=155417 RepID=A0A4Q4TWC2_9PEZI|nr:hypothetical protein DL764_000340 [Monosporascus ibericus]
MGSRRTLSSSRGPFELVNITGFENGIRILILDTAGGKYSDGINPYGINGYVLTLGHATEPELLPPNLTILDRKAASARTGRSSGTFRGLRPIGFNYTLFVGATMRS